MNQGFNVRTSQSDEWQTPRWVFDALDAEFGFTLDGAASEANKLCKRFTGAGCGIQEWAGERVFCNPPYSDIMPFVWRAFDAELAVLLLPVRTDSDWHRVLQECDVELRYWRKRIAFLQNGKEMDSPRFASLVAIVKGRA